MSGLGFMVQGVGSMVYGFSVQGFWFQAGGLRLEDSAVGLEASGFGVSSRRRRRPGLGGQQFSLFFLPSGVLVVVPGSATSLLTASFARWCRGNPEKEFRGSVGRSRKACIENLTRCRYQGHLDPILCRILALRGFWIWAMSSACPRVHSMKWYDN